MKTKIYLKLQFSHRELAYNPGITYTQDITESQIIQKDSEPQPRDIPYQGLS